MSRHDDALKIRREAADIAFNRPHASAHPTNREEDTYKNSDDDKNFIANYTKGLKHHEITNRDAGEVIGEDYKKLLDAIKSGKQDDFDKIPLGVVGGRKFTNPQAGLAFDLEGPDSHDSTYQTCSSN